MLEPSVLVLLLALGTWSALDGTAVGQLLISRPIVSATLAGWIVSDPQTGLMVGVLLEGIYLGEAPIGGARLPEPGPGAIPAALLASLHGGPGGLAAGVALGAAWGMVGGITVHWQRRANGWMTRRTGDRGPMTGARLSRLHWSCLLLDASRGLTLTAAGVVAALLVPPAWPARWDLGLGPTVALLAIPGLISGGALLRSWLSPRRRGLLVLLGGCVGFALAILL